MQLFTFRLSKRILLVFGIVRTISLIQISSMLFEHFHHFLVEIVLVVLGKDLIGDYSRIRRGGFYGSPSCQNRYHGHEILIHGRQIFKSLVCFFPLFKINGALLLDIIGGDVDVDISL